MGPRGFKAKLFIPCASNRCPERMQLRFVTTENIPLERPYYQCMNSACYYADPEHALFPEEMRTEYVIDSEKSYARLKSDEKLSYGEGVTAL